MARPSSKRSAILTLSRAGRKPSEISNMLDVPRRTVYHTIKRGTQEDRPRSGRPVTATSSRITKIVKKRIQRKGQRSMRKMAAELHVSVASMIRVIRKKLKKFPYKFQKRHGLTEAQRKGRRQECRLLLARAENGDHLTTVFSDEKLFTVDAHYNRQNSRILAESSQQANDACRVIECNSHPAQVMVWAAVSSSGRTLVFVPKGAKIDTNAYID